MRDRVIDALGDLAHSRFLVYLMGPYKTFDIDPVLDAAETEAALDLDQLPENVDFGRLVGADVDSTSRKPSSTSCCSCVIGSAPIPV
jgi:hypothetical protein